MATREDVGRRAWGRPSCDHGGPAWSPRRTPTQALGLRESARPCPPRREGSGPGAAPSVLRERQRQGGLEGSLLVDAVVL